jgi:hypothetical protein
VSTENKATNPPTVLSNIPGGEVGKKVQQIINSATEKTTANKIECVLNEANGTWTIRAYQRA